MDKTFFSAKLNQETPPSVIHGWKATDLPFMMVKRKKYFFHPVKRQIFGDASGKTSAPILTVCLKLWQGPRLDIRNLFQGRIVISARPGTWVRSTSEVSVLLSKPS